jgi:hypothetical protein
MHNHRFDPDLSTGVVLMKHITFLLIAIAAVAGLAVSTARASGATDTEAAPIYGVTIPPGYRDWKMIAVAQLLVPGKIDQLRAQFGNEIAIKAYKEGTRPFPDGAIIVAAHWDSRLGGRQQRSPGRSISRGAILRCRVSRKYSGHGQGLKEVRRHGRVGVR